MKSKYFSFLIAVFVLLAVVFGIHIVVLGWIDLPIFNDRIILSYILNYVLAGLLFVIVQRSVTKKSTMTAFIFMAGSAFKFLIFFSVFYPVYQEDTIMQTTEFTAFFVPYAVCLIAEVSYLSKQLNNQTYSEETSEEKKEIK